MSWSATDTAIKAGHKEHLSRPVNFTPATQDVEQEQWRVAVEAAALIMQRGVVGRTGNYTIALSGTSTTKGHAVGDTLTITVTSA